MKIGNSAGVCLLFFLSQMAGAINSYPQEILDAEPFEFNADYTPSLGERIYTLKAEGTTVKKIPGVINGIKEDLNDTTYMIVEFQEMPLSGAPVFFDGKVIGMVYRQSSPGDLFEVMPVKVIITFLKNLNYPAKVDSSGVKIPRSDAEEKAPEDRISEVRRCIEAGDYDKAVKILTEELEKNPDTAGLHGWMGIAMMEMGNARQAAIEFKKAIAIEPGNADFHNGLGYALLAAENFNEAITSFKEALRINPRHADAHYGIGRAYVNLGEIELATKEYIILKDINNKMADNLFNLIMRGGHF